MSCYALDLGQFVNHREDSPVIGGGGLPWPTRPFAIKEVAGAFFLLDNIPDSCVW